MSVRSSMAAAAALFAAATAVSPAMADGILVIDSDRVLNTSTVGEDIRAKLQTIAEQMDSELQTESSPLQSEWEQFQAEVAPLDRAALGEREDLVARGQDLQQRIARLSVSEQIKARELVATRQQALTPVREALNAVLEAMVEEMQPDAIIERELLVFAGESVDITDQVIERLNQQIQSVDVERVTINVEDGGDAG